MIHNAFDNLKRRVFSAAFSLSDTHPTQPHTHHCAIHTDKSQEHNSKLTPARRAWRRYFTCTGWPKRNTAATSLHVCWHILNKILPLSMHVCITYILYRYPSDSLNNWNHTALILSIATVPSCRQFGKPHGGKVA